MNHCRGFLESFGSEVCEGYDECFDPPLEKKYECPICLLGLRETVQTPCGHRFCQDCILRSISDAGQKCPVDNEHLEVWQLYPDNFAKREMLNHPVFCRLSKLYHCPWKGPLGKLQDHFKECDFVDVFCPKSCGKEFLRKDLKRHLEHDCPNRTISCTFCREELLWNSLENHFQDCPQYLLSCEKCGTENIPRNKMQDHNEKECPMAELRCPLSVVGCPFEGPRPAVDKHVKDNLLSHLADLIKELKKSCPLSTRGEVEAQEQASQDGNLATLCQQQQTEIDKMRGMIERLAYELTEACMRLNNLESIFQQQLMGIDGFRNELRTRVERQLQEFSIRLNNQDVRTFEVEGYMNNGSYICSIGNYLQRRQEAINCTGTAIHGPAFYTHPNGYKMCLGINLNGTDSGVGRYIALFVHMMPGDYDNRIKWPFTPRRITFTILDQSEDTESPRRQHISKSLNAESNLLTFQRPTAPGINSGVGFVEFAPIELIREPRYFENNTMKVRIQIEQSED